MEGDKGSRDKGKAQTAPGEAETAVTDVGPPEERVDDEVGPDGAKVTKRRD